MDFRRYVENWTLWWFLSFFLYFHATIVRFSVDGMFNGGNLKSNCVMLWSSWSPYAEVIHVV